MARTKGNARNNALKGSKGRDTLLGLDGKDKLMGMGGNDLLKGGAHNDRLDGGTGRDRLIGGLDNDIYVVENAKDRTIEKANEGKDTVRASVNWKLGNNIENLNLTGKAIKGTGNDLKNALRGTAANNVLQGLGGNDRLISNAGNDKLDGGIGRDRLIGGTGNDKYFVDNTGDKVFEKLDQGIDTVISKVDWTLAANVERLILKGSAVQGTGNELDNKITGNSANNVLKGGAGNDTLLGKDGNDTLDGGAGDDIMSGGVGDDIYYVDSVNDIVNELDGEGYDIIYSTDLNYVKPDSVEELIFIDANGNVIPGPNPDPDPNPGPILGDDGDNTLVGTVLDDVIEAGLGNDILDGGLGADELIGGLGDDTYLVDNAGDIVTELLDEGADLVQSTLDSYSLTDDVENLTLVGDAIEGIGNALDNIITGNDLNNILDGGLGADELIGGLGDDTYLVDNAGDIVTELLDEGADLVQSTLDSYTLTDDVENLTLVGDAVEGIGNALDNIITGNDLNNILDGGAGNDQLLGGLGNDLLKGGLGTNVLDGGAGVDQLISSGTADILTGGDGADSFILNGDGVATITDFISGTDALQLSTGLLNSLGLGNLIGETLNLATVDQDSQVGGSVSPLVYSRQSQALYANTNLLLPGGETKLVTLGVDSLNAPDLSIANLVGNIL